MGHTQNLLPVADYNFLCRLFPPTPANLSALFVLLQHYCYPMRGGVRKGLEHLAPRARRPRGIRLCCRYCNCYIPSNSLPSLVRVTKHVRSALCGVGRMQSDMHAIVMLPRGSYWGTRNTHGAISAIFAARAGLYLSLVFPVIGAKRECF